MQSTCESLAVQIVVRMLILSTELEISVRDCSHILLDMVTRFGLQVIITSGYRW